MKLVLRMTAIALAIGGLPFDRAASAAPPENNLVYHILVRSFSDSDDTDPEAYGDLRGLQSQLDPYLNDGKPETDHDLEAGILWLMPIFPAKSYHGYNVNDYENVSPDLGTLADLKNLVAAAHARGVRIILDIPFNHTSDEHIWFKQAVAGDAAMRKHYFFRAGGQQLTDGWHKIVHNGVESQYFGLFDKSMPDLNFDESTVKTEVKRIAKHWLDIGIDGFRLDAAKHIFGDTFGELTNPQILKNNDWWLEFSNHCNTVNPKTILVGEVLGGGEALRRHAYGLEALLDEPFMHDARHQIAFPQSGFVARQRDALNAERDVNRLAPHVPDRPYSPFYFIGSHDENPRLASKLEEFRGQGMAAEVDQAYRVGMYLLLSIGKYPVVYYGEEVMQRGFKWNGDGDGSGIFDETLREPFPWYKSGTGTGQTNWFPPRFDKADDGVSREEQGAEGGMLHLVRGITNLRTRHPVLADGDIGEILSDTHDWMVFERAEGARRYLVLINPTGEAKDYQFHEGWFPRYFNAQLLFWSDGKNRKWADETAADKRIEKKVEVPAYGMVVLQQRD